EWLKAIDNCSNLDIIRPFLNKITFIALTDLAYQLNFIQINIHLFGNLIAITTSPNITERQIKVIVNYLGQKLEGLRFHSSSAMSDTEFKMLLVIVMY